MRKILILTADRAERGLLEPVMAELKKKSIVEASWCELDSKLRPGENIAILGAKMFEFSPDIVVVPCDRAEMVYAAAYAFHNNKIVCHFHAGNNNTNHPDDFNRRAISLFSHILLCNMKEHAINLALLGEDPNRIHVVGSTAFDDLHFDDSITPKAPFDLVILHPDPTSIEKTQRDLRDTIKVVDDSFANEAIWIYPNHDKNFECISSFLKTIKIGGCNFGPTPYSVQQKIIAKENLPRNQFLSLLKHCYTAIGNSSSFYYELPVLNTQPRLVHIGDRNRGLVVPPAMTGGSKRIADILENIEINDQLRVKRVHN